MDIRMVLAETYLNGTKQSGAEVKKIRIADFNFNPYLELGYQKRMELKSDLLEAIELIR